MWAVAGSARDHRLGVAQVSRGSRVARVRDGKVEQVHAKRHDIADSWGVYGITLER